MEGPSTENEVKVHPQHWCGQHKFEADSPTNFYDYSNTNDKEKSAMCRIAEIARFNKIRHYYYLQDESGPAHKKLFTVKLVLTTEETFEGSGTSIKRAQQASAESALLKTKLPLPVEKPPRKKSEASKPHRVLQNVCRTLQYSTPHYVSCNPPPLAMQDGHGNVFLLGQDEVPNQQLQAQEPKLLTVIVNINGKPFATGLGETFQVAKQDAASKALALLSPLLREHQTVPVDVDEKENIPKHKQKSVISDIHEKAHQLKLNVIFEVLKEEGPPHDRLYLVRCAFVTSNNTVKAEAIGKGRKKKSAQQEACTLLLKNVGLFSPDNNPVALATNVCKTQKKLAAMNREPKRKTIVKDKKMDPLYGHQINPVSRLIQVTQAKNQPHPTFELVAEHGLSKYKEFVIKVTCGDENCEGKGPNKRLAKRAAAEAMLELIGYVKPLPAPGKSLLKKIMDPMQQDFPMQDGVPAWEGAQPAKPPSEHGDTEEEREGSPDTEKRRVTFNSQVHACPPPGDQDYPNSIVTDLKKDAIVEGKIRRLKRSKENRRALTPEQMADVAERAKEAVASIVDSANAYFHLDQLSSMFKFTVQYTTLPEPEPDQHFTLVSLGLEEPMVCHGTGCTPHDADESAALAALIKLQELCLPKDVSK